MQWYIQREPHPTQLIRKRHAAKKKVRKYHLKGNHNRLDLDLDHPRLNILLEGKLLGVDGADIADANMALAVSIELSTLGKVEVDGVAPRNGEEDERDAHGLSRTNAISHVTEDDRSDGTTADGGDEERGTALGVATETAEGKSKDDWEDARLEEEHNHEHAQTTPVGTVLASSVCSNSRGDEDHDQRLKGKEHVARLATKVHESSSSETTDGE